MKRHFRPAVQTFPVIFSQKYSVQTFDQQLYSIAKQVAWAMPDTFRNHILRLAGFHTLSCYIAAIGKLWGDGGLKDLLVDSSVYAAGTVDQTCSVRWHPLLHLLMFSFQLQIES
jgi:hypothetical protein